MSLVLLLGGARSGKSALAVELGGEAATLIATATADDAEMAERIRRHRAERSAAWTTIEEPLRLGAALVSASPDSPVVLDCLSLWVSNLMAAGWQDDAIEGEARSVAAEASSREALTVAVSNEVGLGIVPANPLARRYRDVLGRVNADWALAADRALLVVAGRTVELGRP
jgi:adenosyl cobinamide kinase/adenosyl cobinamide phosphate guanylyltransferase